MRQTAPDAAAIKNTEAVILQQLAQVRYIYTSCSSVKLYCSVCMLCRALVESKPGGGGGGVASEQLQPLYEVKTLVQQNAQRLAAVEQRLKVRPVLQLLCSPDTPNHRTRPHTSALL